MGHDGIEPTDDQDALEPADQDIEFELQSSGREACAGYGAAGAAFGPAMSSLAEGTLRRTPVEPAKPTVEGRSRSRHASSPTSTERRQPGVTNPVP